MLNEDKENALFREAMGDIRNLNHDKVTHEQPKTDHHPRQLIADEEPGDILNAHQNELLLFYCCLL